MKSKNYIPLAIGLLVSMVMLATFGNFLPGEILAAKTDIDDIDRVEDLIIIDGIRMNADTPPLDGDIEFSSGGIIYDDSFDDSHEPNSKKEGTSAKKIKSAVKKVHIPPSVNRRDIMRRLRKKDPRWHLTVHRIRDGENLWMITKRFKTDHKLIIMANAIRNPEMLRAGRVIQVPNRIGVTYTVKKGESIGQIAKRHHISKKTLIAHNRLGDRHLAKGSKLFLPDVRRAVYPRLSTRHHDRMIARHNQKIHADKDSGQEQEGEIIAARKPSEIARNRAPRFIWPIRGKITSTFGTRIDPFIKKKRFHCGIDISADLGKRVVAARTGTVIFSGWKPAYGNMVIIKHAGGYISVYAHNQKNMVKQGEKVKSGQLISLSGMTGAATGGHVHFEIRKYLTPLNPLRLLP